MWSPDGRADVDDVDRLLAEHFGEVFVNRDAGELVLFEAGVGLSGLVSQTATSEQLGSLGIRRTCHSPTTPVPTTAAFH